MHLGIDEILQSLLQETAETSLLRLARHAPRYCLSNTGLGLSGSRLVCLSLLHHNLQNARVLGKEMPSLIDHYIKRLTGI